MSLKRDPPMVNVKQPERVLAGFHGLVGDASGEAFWFEG